MKFPFGAGKFLVCRFLGNVARDGALGETLVGVIPVCPQPGVTHLRPILGSEFSLISLGWKIAPSMREWDRKNKWLGFMVWISVQACILLGQSFCHWKGVRRRERALTCVRCFSVRTSETPWFRWQKNTQHSEGDSVFKLAEGALHPLVQIVDKGMDENRPHQRALGIPLVTEGGEDTSLKRRKKEKGLCHTCFFKTRQKNAESIFL